ncbi:MAG TPA: class II glutamine amidotransferase [Solirubrobacteraceae bacterium]|jgi:glutamine amidotransferase|nr:class II glutamine amidotransferase [Solirubrobacteraceae bacterium]
MCRLFGMSGAPRRVNATFWLLDAEDSLAAQSRREPDGTGLGYFAPDGSPVVEKQPIAAYEDRAFAREAREACSPTFIAHIRYASTGGLVANNTHPFAQHGRLFAHNGVIEDLPSLEQHLGDQRSLVAGDTDSERFFALVTKETEARGGDLTAGLTAAARWVAEHLPLFALNVLLATPESVWALRYPETHELHVLDRPGGGRHLDHASAAGTVRVRSAELAEHPAVVIASEPMDADSRWRALEPGELLRVDPGPRISSSIVLPDPPAHPLTLADLRGQAATSQS